MQTNSEITTPTPRIRDIANAFRVTGWASFWIQLGLLAVSSIALLFATTGQNFAEGAITGLGIGIFWGVCGIVLLGFALFLALRYTQIANRLLGQDAKIRPKKADTIRLLQIGLIASLAGILLSLFGAGSAVGVLVAKTVSQPPGVAITDPNKIVRALDVFVVVANICGVTGHYVGTVAALWLLKRVPD
ncbi:MAG: DUF3611 family protein [Desertifilum sp. SIO1I2]|nr:DUF3611 family protein [Desertifilum sp. SIO1I2]